MNIPQVPQPVPYPLPHNGPKRVLTMHLKRGMSSQASVSVLIDGLTFPTHWGTSSYEIPADRPVSVSAQQAALAQASYLLTPDQPAELVYQGPAMMASGGELGPPGTVQQRGLGCMIPLLIVLGLAIVAFVLVLVILISI